MRKQTDGGGGFAEGEALLVAGAAAPGSAVATEGGEAGAIALVDAVTVGPLGSGAVLPVTGAISKHGAGKPSEHAAAKLIPAMALVTNTARRRRIAARSRSSSSAGGAIAA